MCGWHKVDNACPIKSPTVASSLRGSKTIMTIFRNRAVPSRVLRSKIEQLNKTERLEASTEKGEDALYSNLQGIGNHNDFWYFFVLVVIVVVVVVVVDDVAVASDDDVDDAHLAVVADDGASATGIVTLLLLF